MERLPYNAQTPDEVIQYFKTRQLQIASQGYYFDENIYKNEYGFHCNIEKDGKQYNSFYVLKQDRNKGYSKKLLSELGEIVTIDDCHVVDYLTKIGKNFHVVKGDFDTIEYKMVENYYGDGKANRSKVYFMNHIDEGMIILNYIQASKESKAGFCLHPMAQNNEDLEKNFKLLSEKINPYNLGLSIEYRNIANQYLSKRKIKSLDDIQLSPLKEVNDMLIADKVQNYKDFLLYHKITHHRSTELEEYFNNWLDKLKCRDVFEWYINFSKQFDKKFTLVNQANNAFSL